MTNESYSLPNNINIIMISKDNYTEISGKISNSITISKIIVPIQFSQQKFKKSKITFF